VLFSFRGRTIRSPLPDISNDACGNPGDYRICRHIARHNCASSYERPNPDRDAAHHCTVAAERDTIGHSRPGQRPVIGSLQPAILIYCTWIQVIDEHHPMADEDAVPETHAAADKRMAGDFAVTANVDTFLDLDKCADPGPVAYRATIQVDQSRLVNDDITAQNYVSGYHFDGVLALLTSLSPA
jgi:hypothetical protein